MAQLARHADPRLAERQISGARCCGAGNLRPVQARILLSCWCATGWRWAGRREALQTLGILSLPSPQPRRRFETLEAQGNWLLQAVHGPGAGKYPAQRAGVECLA